MPKPEPEFVASRPTERLIFFSDAVVAIAITLLAIDLPVPEGSTMTAFWNAVQHNTHEYVAFLISFYVIAMSWSNHHDAFAYVSRVDPRIRTQNFTWLLTIVLNPFATKLLITSGSATPARFGFYAVIQLVSAGILFLMLRHMSAAGLMPDAPPAVVRQMIMGSYVAMLAFGISIPVFFATSYGWILWIVIPLIAGRLLALRRHGADSSQLS